MVDFIENIPRMLPEGIGVEITLGIWTIPPIFKYLEEKGELDNEEMFNIFNMGIGYCCSCRKEEADEVLDTFEKNGEKASIIGTCCYRRRSGICGGHE